ncbi:MAG: hypothetical protein IJF07_09930, partial [Lachnospiraceae bacterium]|nr:hypothetical protein [Lachnospiraceae bacterium]
KDKHDFVIGHMVIMGCNGRIPGIMEYYDPEETEEGLKICIKSASPFVIGWKEAEVSEKEPDDEKVPVDDTEDSDDNDDDSDDPTPVTDSKTSPKTYDDSKAATKGQKDVATPDGNAQEKGVVDAMDDTVVSVAVPPQTSSNWFIVLAIVLIAVVAITTGIKIYRNKFEEF